MKNMTLLILILAALALLVPCYAQEQKVTTGSWVVGYYKEVVPSSDTECYLSVETVDLDERKPQNANGDVSVSFLDFSIGRIFSFDQEKGSKTFCRLIVCIEAKKTLERLMGPKLEAILLQGYLADKSEEYLKAPGTSLDDPAWKQAVRDAEEKSKNSQKGFQKTLEKAVVIGKAGNNDILLLDGEYGKVANPEKLQAFLGKIQPLAETVIAELKKNGTLSEATKRELDALAGLKPEDYGMGR